MSLFALVSDLHLEASGIDLSWGNARLLAACGDICAPSRLHPPGLHVGVEWLARHAQGRPVLFVPGNHDYEGCRFDQALEIMRETVQGTDVHVLCNDTFDFEGVRFLGTPLFSDFKGCIEPVENLLDVSLPGTDMKRAFDEQGRPLTVRWMLEKHHQARAFLERELVRDPDIPKVVLTHWPPTLKAVDPRFAHHDYNGYWASDCEDLVEQAHVWCHGHIHETRRMHIGNDPEKGQLYSNPRGFCKTFNLATNTQFHQPCMVGLTPRPSLGFSRR